MCSRQRQDMMITEVFENLRMLRIHRSRLSHGTPFICLKQPRLVKARGCFWFTELLSPQRNHTLLDFLRISAFKGAVRQTTLSRSR